MQLYVVGGAVRDRLLGLPATDRDWVAVGATPEELLALGYKPVGRDFPVFLHPQTGEEVALARTERKTGRGYTGFAVHAAPGVTLEEDLGRRDLTINAIAEADDGTLIDPFGGQADLRAKVLRHVSPAFVEDPVRLLRLARFAARFPDFTVAPETGALLVRMVASGEVDALVPERAWQEIARGLAAARPGRMLVVLQGCGALRRLLPELHAGAETLAPYVDRAADAQASTAVAWACLLAAGGCTEAEAHAASVRLRAPVEARDLASGLLREGSRALQGCDAAEAADLLALMERHDAFRRPARFAQFLEAQHLLNRDPPQLQPAWRAARAVDARAVTRAAAEAGAAGPALSQALREARRAAIEAVLLRPFS